MSARSNRFGTTPIHSYQVLCQRSAAGFLSILVLLCCVACSKRYSDLPAFTAFPFRDYDNQSVGRFKTSFLVDQFDTFYRGTNPGPIGVTTFVNLDDLYTTSSFGRMLAEQTMSELAMKGFDVIELRHTDALQFLSTAGEFALSRDAGFVRRERELGGVVVGTYAASPERVYVNARLLDPTTSRILTAGSVEMERTVEITKLLRGGTIAATLERIPVKHIGFSSVPMNVFSQGGSRMQDLEASGGGQPDAWAAPNTGASAPQLQPAPPPAGKGLKLPH